MLGTSLMMLVGGFLLMLRLSPGGSFPNPLSAEEEREYLERWLNGDIEARNILVEHNLRLVAHIIKKYYTQTNDIEDLISIGTIGLIKGINTYKPDKGVRLATYASRCCENEILMHLRKIQNQKTEVSIDEPLNVDWDGNELLLSDILGTDGDTVNRELEQEVERSALRALVSGLGQRDQLIMRLRFGLDDGEERTQKEVADIIGISQSYISRLEKKIIRQLRKEMERIY